VSEPARITAHAAVTDVRAAGLARVIQQLRGKPAFDALLATYLDEIQAIETAAWQLYALAIDNSEGDALDQIGDLFDTPRPPSMTDAVFRRVLHASVAALHASGTGNDIVRVARALVGSDAFSVREVFPAAVIVEPDAAVGIPVDVMRRVLRLAKSGGVGLQVIDVPAGDTFAFSTSMMHAQTDASRGFSDTTQAAGGVLVGVM
jgi:hypothetical protein